MIIRRLPVTIRNIAVKSYFQMNFSPRQKIDRHALTIIAVAELLVNSVKSANGSTTKIWILDDLWKLRSLTCMNQTANDHKTNSE